MIFVISLVFIFLTRLRFPSRLSIAEVSRKRYGDRTLKLVRKFEKTDNKHKKALLDVQFSKICEDRNVIQSFHALKLLILIYTLLRHTGDVKENFYGKRFTTENLLLGNLTEDLNCYIIMLSPI